MSNGVDRRDWELAALSSDGFAALLASSRPFVVLVPVGSVEPHGPHLPLGTDALISQGACAGAVAMLDAGGVTGRVTAPVPFGVTDCAAGFAGAVSVPAAALAAYLRAVVDGLFAAGIAHVCLVNNHLEPAHDAAVRAAIAGLPPGRASVACPLAPRWARTLSDEFKSGACHAGRYETAIVMAESPALIDEGLRRGLPAVPISLSDQLRAGVTTFAAMGMDRAYAGAPAEATAAEGQELLERLAVMVTTEVLDALRKA